MIVDSWMSHLGAQVDASPTTFSTSCQESTISCLVFIRLATELLSTKLEPHDCHYDRFPAECTHLI